MGIEQSMIQKRVGHDRITSFHTVFQNLRTVGCLNFYDIFDVCLSVCHPQMTRNSVHLFLPPKRKDRAILENSKIFKYFLFGLSRIDQLSEVILFSEAAVFRCFHCMCSRR